MFWHHIAILSPPALAVMMLALTVILLAANRIRPQVLALLVLGLVGALGLVPYQSLFQGFANPAVIIIAAMMILGEALQRTGVTARLGRLMAQHAAGGEKKTIALLMLATALPSALVSDVGTIAIFIRIIEGLRTKLGFRPERLLIPIAFSASLGGLLTLLGSSGNILADQFLRRAGYPGLSLFATTPVAVILVATAVVYMLVVGRRLLPRRPDDDSQRLIYGLRQYQAEMEVLETFPGCGRTLEDIALPAKLGVSVLRLRRGDGTTVQHPDAHTVVGAGDRLWVQGPALNLLRSHGSVDFPGLRLLEEEEVEGSAENHVEALVTQGSPLLGYTLAELRFRQRYGVSVIAVSRLGEISVGNRTTRQPPASQPGLLGRLFLQAGRHGRAGLKARSREMPGEPVFPEVESLTRSWTARMGKIGQAIGRRAWGITSSGTGRRQAPEASLADMRFQVGDTLVLRGPAEGLANLVHSGVLLLQQELDHRPPRTRKAVFSAAVMGAVLLAGATGLLPLAVAAVLGAGTVILLGCVTPEEAQRAVDLRLLVLIAGMMALGAGLERTGVVAALVNGILGVAGRSNPLLILGSVYLLAALVTQVLSNAVTVVLMAPLALQAAAAVHLDPTPFVVAVVVAVSASPASPYGNQVNLLVMGPGRYRPADYVKIGLPLALINMAVAMALIPLLWPFRL